MLFFFVAAFSATNCLAQVKSSNIYDNYKQSNSKYVSQYTGSISKEVENFVKETRATEIKRANVAAEINTKILQNHFDSIIEKNNTIKNIDLRNATATEFNEIMSVLFEKIDELEIVLDREFTSEIMKLMTETYNKTFTKHLNSFTKGNDSVK